MATSGDSFQAAQSRDPQVDVSVDFETSSSHF